MATKVIATPTELIVWAQSSAASPTRLRPAAGGAVLLAVALT
jgi:hypothetical protein